MMDEAGDNGIHANCGQCMAFVSCRKWRSLLQARHCPSYDTGAVAMAQRYLGDIWRLLGDEKREKPKA